MFYFITMYCAGLPSAYSEEHLPILYSEEPWYKNNHPAHPALGQLVTGYLIPGHLTPGYPMSRYERKLRGQRIRNWLRKNRNLYPMAMAW